MSLHLHDWPNNVLPLITIILLRKPLIFLLLTAKILGQSFIFFGTIKIFIKFLPSQMHFLTGSWTTNGGVSWTIFQFFNDWAIVIRAYFWWNIDHFRSTLIEIWCIIIITLKIWALFFRVDAFQVEISFIVIFLTWLLRFYLRMQNMPKIFLESIYLDLVIFPIYSAMSALKRLAIHAIAVFWPDNFFDSSIIILTIGYDMINIRFRGKSTIYHIVDNMHSFFQSNTQNFRAQVAILIEFKVHLLLYVITWYLTHTFLSIYLRRTVL